MRYVVLDTETTGLEPSSGHRIIEIGCVELIGRKLTGNRLHLYIHPERDVPDEAIQVHGITNEFLQDKPVFSAVAEQFYDFVKGSTLIIHNAPFDMGFINNEFSLLNSPIAPLENVCEVIDTLLMARQLRPGQRNNLDALCKHYGVDNSRREYHGALLDAEILADVYLAMTGGQVTLELDSSGDEQAAQEGASRIDRAGLPVLDLPVIKASAAERERHEKKLQRLNKAEQGCLWLQLAEQ